MTFRLQVQPGVPYRVWARVKTVPVDDKPLGAVVFIQFSGACDKAGRELFPLGSREYFTMRAPARVGWGWVGRDHTENRSPDLIVYFKSAGDAQIRVTAGSAGGLDQVILSPLKYLTQPPAQEIVPKPR